MKTLTFALSALALLTAPAFARDTYVHGYTRSNGTYVAPHVRTTPDSSRANNYGPSNSGGSFGGMPSYGLISRPTTRDHDRDGTPNYLDHDDDNDTTHDNADRSQYGRASQPYSYPSPYQSKN